MRLLSLMLVSLSACEDSKLTLDSADSTAGGSADLTVDSAIGETGDSEDTSIEVTVLKASISGYGLPRRDQIYDMEVLSSYGKGCVAIGNPYSEGFTGAVYVVCPGALDLPDDAEVIWAGTGNNQALGCNIEVSELDGVEVIGSSEFADPTYVGRGLVWPTSASSGIAADAALVDVSGTYEGDGFTGGYFGTMIMPYNGRIVASQTNAIPYLLSAPYADDLAIEDFSPLVDGGSAYVDATTGGFAGYDASTGDDGIAVASFGGIVQHLDTDGSSDWWIDISDSGVGEYPWPEDPDVTRWTATNRLHTGEVVVSVYSHYARSSREATYALIVDPLSGLVLDDLSNAYGVASGVLDGVEWRAVGIETCDPSFDTVEDCRNGYIEIETATDTLVVSLPFEADTFPAGGCLLNLVSDGVSEVGWFCKDARYGGFLSLSLDSSG